MAEFKSTTAAAQDAAGSNAANMIATAELISGKVQFLQCEVTIPAGTALNDTIVLAYIPAGATIIPGLITVQTVTACGANEIAIGDATDFDSVTASLVCNASGVQHLLPNSSSVKYAARTPLIATLAEGTLTEGGKFFLNIPLVNSN